MPGSPTNIIEVFDLPDERVEILFECGKVFRMTRAEAWATATDPEKAAALLRRVER